MLLMTRWPVLAPLACVLLLLLSCAAVQPSAAEDDADVQVLYIPIDEYNSNPATAGWLEPLAVLCQRIVMLPYEPASAARALRFIRAHRLAHEDALAGSTTHAHLVNTSWAHRIPYIRIVRMELHSFPESASMSKRWDGTVLDLDVDADDSEAADEGTDEDMTRVKPRLMKASILHVLAARGFSEALGQVLQYIPTEERQQAVNTFAQVAATLKFNGVTPLHLLALYAPDTDPTSEGNGQEQGNVAAARILVSAGINLTACIQKVDSPDLTALAFAAERGHVHLMKYLLDAMTPPLLDAPYTSFSRSSAEQEELAIWVAHRAKILAHDVAGVPETEEDGSPFDWSNYLRWFDTQRPMTEDEERNDEFLAHVFKALELAVVSNRSQAVRLILDGPHAGYGMRARINQRSHGGRGDALVHGAVVHGLKGMVELLLSYGADVALPSYDGLSLMQLAIEYKKMDVAAFLEKYLKELRPPPRGVRLPEHPQREETTPADKKQDAAASTAATTAAPSASSAAHDEL